MVDPLTGEVAGGNAVRNTQDMRAQSQASKRILRILLRVLVYKKKQIPLPTKKSPQESEHASPEKSSTSRDIPAMEEEGENSQNSPGSIRALFLISGGAFFLPILLPMVS